MDRLRSVSNAWNWLPAFRAVAEYESIHKAAAVLNVSASALSRTVRLLEDAVGAMLFVRSATGLTLTSFGAELLRGTRDAMRRIDDVLEAERGVRADRIFAMGASGPVLPRLLDCALARVLSAATDVSYRTNDVADEDVAAELLRGNLDVAVVESGPGLEHPPEITSVKLGELAFAWLAPPGHALAVGSTAEAEDALAGAKAVTLARVVLPEGAPRSIVAVAASMESAERLAERGPFLAFLPRVLAPAGYRMVLASTIRIGAVALFRTPLEKEAPLLVQTLVDALLEVVRGAPDPRPGTPHQDSNAPIG